MEDFFEKLNNVQRQAVETDDGPLMVIAGAGSGKTRVLTYRLAYLLSKGVEPFSIMALTFTNKAAREMKSRVEELVGSEAKNVWMGTFHAIFARLLRIDGYLLGYPKEYTIYDTDDSKSALRKVINELGIDIKIYPINVVLSRISAAKSRLISYQEYNSNIDILDYDKKSHKPELGKIYRMYQESLFRSSAMDFDDIIFNFNLLISNFPEILMKYQQRFKHILIDEFQDTNTAQYAIIQKIAAPQNNISIVGDDAQSIYAFRGANIGNILGLKDDYPNLKVFKLEQNYRSTQHIVEASNSVISKNKNQIQKNLWTKNEEGELIEIIHAITEQEEASKVASSIFEKEQNDHINHNEFAVLYRTNAQSRAFEEAFRRKNMPYIIYGGLSFYQRKEIKDTLAYFRLTINNNDEEALLRVINFPARGIGNTSIEKIQNYASKNNIKTWAVLENKELLQKSGISSSTIAKIDTFTTMVQNFSNKIANTSAYELAKEIVVKSLIFQAFGEDNSAEGIARKQNIEELINAIGNFAEKRIELTAVENYGEINTNEIVTLDMFMQDVALLTDKDTQTDDENKITLMTVHAAKGLEFSHVYVVGLEENLFPSSQNIYEREDLEEERRLLYVACTRAKKTLTLSYAENRYRWGKQTPSEPSRFLNDFDRSHFKTQHSQYGINNTFVSSLRPIKSANQQSETTNITPSDYNSIKINDNVLHAKFGKGTVISLEGVGPNKKAKVIFENVGEKLLLLNFAKLQILN